MSQVPLGERKEGKNVLNKAAVLKPNFDVVFFRFSNFFFFRFSTAIIRNEAPLIF
jgi:hypothetical protein